MWRLLRDRWRRPEGSFPLRLETMGAHTDWRTAAAERPSLPDEAVSDLFREIEDTALAIYQAHGLPVRKGHYVWSPDAGAWAFVAEALTPEERWALALDRPANAGWRFATLDQLGSGSASPEVASAAALLAGVRSLTASLRGADAASARTDIEAAIRLGAEWRALQQSRVGPARDQLRLVAPARAKRRKPQGREADGPGR